MIDNFETGFINQTVEATPFSKTPARKFFAKWCEINDSMVPRFITRWKWRRKSTQGILEKNEEGKQTLFLPKDLHLWEMMDVIKTVDHDTYARKPELREQRADQLQELGQTFEKAGIYLNHYLPEVTEGKEIAQGVTHQFYSYGRSLQEKTRKTEEAPQNTQLTEEDKQQLDEWFLGRDAYQKRLDRFGSDPTEEQKEETRTHLIKIYFKALAREGYQAEGEKPWQIIKGPFQHLHDKTKRQITKAIQTPEREMKTSIFRRGLEKLVTEMKIIGWMEALQNLLNKGANLDLANEQIKLYQSLKIPKLKKELEEVRAAGDTAQISTKELEIAKKIQEEVGRFPYQEKGNNPSEMVETQFINCVGASILGGGLLDEVGIKYLHVGLPKHSATVLITSDDKVRWQDLTPPGITFWNYKEITNKDIIGTGLDGKTLTIADIVAFANHPSDKGLHLEINKWWYDLNMTIMKMPYRYLNLFNPETGLQSQILWHLGSYFNSENMYEEALSVYEYIIQINSNSSPGYYSYGNALYFLGRNKEAVEAYRQAINLDSKYAHSYNGLGNVLRNLGRDEEAVKAYKKFLLLENRRSWVKDSQYWIKRAQRIIRKIENK